MHLLGLVSHGRRPFAHRPPARAPRARRARGHGAIAPGCDAFTDGRDVSPHAAIDDLATLPTDRVATVVGRYYAMDRDQRWQRTETALAAICNGEGREADDPVDAVRESYELGVTDEFLEPIVLLETPPSDTPPADAAILFNFRPDRGRQLAQRLLELGVDLTTMTRYSDELDCPAVLAEQTVRGHARRDPERAWDTAAARRRDREVRARDVLLQRRQGGGVGRRDAHPRAVAARRPELRPHARRWLPRRSPTRLSPRCGDGYGFCVVNFANPDMVGPHRRDPGGRARRRGGRRLPRPRRRRRLGCGWRVPRHRRPRERRADARGRRRTAPHGAHHEPGAARARRSRAPRCATEGACATSRRPCSTCLECRLPRR